ncbi:hypothetical protein FRC03_008376 [Tulasnella sp. 419]|nr:hypothetical protein FRC03_008376 [Tulasnella sp. 419]
MASVQHPTVSWEPMLDGQVFYRKQQIYTMQWDIRNLSDYIIAGARYGGPFALMRDPHKMVAFGQGTFTRPTIQVFSSAGELLLALPWDQGNVIAFGWTSAEQLVVLNDEGIYRIHDLQGDYQQFSLGSEAAELGIIDAKIYESGMVAMTSNVGLLEVKGWGGGKPLILANTGLVQPPRCWSIIEPDQTISRHVEVLLADEQTIYSVDNLESIDQSIHRGPFVQISVSPNGKLIALLNGSGLLWIVSSDFQQRYAEYETSNEGLGEPRQVVWCGSDAVVVNWDELVLVVGPYGNSLRHYYTSPAYTLNEMDGVRIIDSSQCDFIQKVPSSSEKVFKPGSTAPAAILFDALEHFERKSPKADEAIRSIRPELAGAVNDVVEAAGQEIEPYWQRRLLHAAQFGRAFLDLYNPTDFVNMGQTLKVLNAVRYYEIGIPITYVQYVHRTPQHLIQRLTSRNMHLLALKMCSYLGIKPDDVLKHWAIAKIAKSKSPAPPPSGLTGGVDEDDAVCKLIVKKFRSVGAGAESGGGVSFAEVAKKAWESGRGRLATMLLDHEPRAADQVPLLLAMNEDLLALTKSISSGDTDLVFHVLLHLLRHMTLGDFFRLLEDGGATLDTGGRLLVVYAKEQNREMLRDYWYQDDRRTESALLALEDATRAKEQENNLDLVKAAAKFFSEDKERGFEAKMTDDHAKLLALQQQLEKESNGKIDFYGLSVSDTIRKCIVNGMNKRAEGIRGAWKVSDKRFWYIKLYALTEARDFEGLDVFAKSKKPPIGYEPFVNHLVEKGFPKQAATYVPKCDAKVRVDLYVKCGEWRNAGMECKERGDKARLDELRRTAPNNLIVRELDQILSSMS